MTTSLPVITYRHPKKEFMFLFINKNIDWKQLPESLQTEFHTQDIVIEFDMTPDKKLARVSGQVVWEALTSQGFFLQLPPADPNAQQQLEDRWIAEQEASKPIQS